jgi:hypothetical protein
VTGLALLGGVAGAENQGHSGLACLSQIPGYNKAWKGKRGCSSVVERLLPKQDIVGSNPITRSLTKKAPASALGPFLFFAVSIFPRLRRHAFCYPTVVVLPSPRD